MKKYIIGFLITASLSVFGQEVGAKGALEDNELTEKKMLTYAIQDEYLAKNEYLGIIEKFGNVRPFSNIVKSEEQHIALLLPLLEKYGASPVSENSLKEKVKVPSSLEVAAQIGVDAEIDNIAMYEKFLAQKGLPEDMRVAFEDLMRASENHLTAFRRQLK